MKDLFKRLIATTALGLLIVGPLYLSLLLVIKALATMVSLLEPIVYFIPASAHYRLWIAILAVAFICYCLGLVVRTSWGRFCRFKLEKSVFERIPGYGIFRGFLRRIAGKEQDNSWQPALVTTDDGALMPVFVIEQLPDGRYTVFVPSVPTPFAGAVFIYQSERVQLVEIPFSQAVKVITHWGQGAGEWVKAKNPSH